MKTAISVPDNVFHRADQAAERLGWSRSQLYTRAVSEFLEHQADDPVTEALNELADDLNAEPTPHVGKRLIDAGRWEW